MPIEAGEEPPAASSPQVSLFDLEEPGRTGGDESESSRKDSEIPVPLISPVGESQLLDIEGIKSVPEPGDTANLTHIKAVAEVKSVSQLSKGVLHKSPASPCIRLGCSQSFTPNPGTSSDGPKGRDPTDLGWPRRHQRSCPSKPPSGSHLTRGEIATMPTPLEATSMPLP